MVSPIPVAIASISVGFLHSTGRLTELTDGFFTHLTVLEQICLASLFFSIIHLCVSIARFLGLVYDESGGDGGGGHSHHDEDIYAAYPFEQMQLAANKRDRFGAMFPTLMDEIVEHLQAQDISLDAIEQVQEALEPLPQSGCDDCGMTVLEIYRIFIKKRLKRDLHFLEEARATVLGWALALLFYSHDIATAKSTKSDPTSVRNAFLMESFVFEMIHKHFHDEPYYHRLVELFLEAKETRALYRLVRTSEMDTEADGPLNRMKTYFCVLYIPIAIGMIMSSIKDDEAYDNAKSICYMLGETKAKNEWRSDVKVQEAIASLSVVPDEAFEVAFDERKNNCMYGKSIAKR